MIGVGLRGGQGNVARPLTRRKTDHYTGAFTEFGQGLTLLPLPWGLTRQKQELQGCRRRPVVRFDRVCKGDRMRKFSSQAVVLALIAGLGVAVTGCGQVKMIQARMALKDGHTAYQQQNYRGAVEAYETAIAADPTQTEAYFYLGNSYDNQFRPTRKGEPENDALLEKAIANYKLAAEREQRPELKRLALQYLANAYGSDKLNDPAQSEPVVQQLIQMDPGEPVNYFALSRIYEDSGDYENAEATLVKAREMKANDPAVYTTLAAYYNRQGEFDKSMEALKARADREPNNPEAFYTMATYYWEKAYRDFSLSDGEKMKYVQLGIEAINKALMLNDQYMEALVYKNLLLRVQANLERNPARQQALLREATELQNRAEEIRKQNLAGPAGAAPAGTSGRRD
jgi:tetratricopeptide (TPR) repeat protein